MSGGDGAGVEATADRTAAIPAAAATAIITSLRALERLTVVYPYLGCYVSPHPRISQGETLRPEGDKEKSSSRAEDCDKPHKGWLSGHRAIAVKIN